MIDYIVEYRSINGKCKVKVKAHSLIQAIDFALRKLYDEREDAIEYTAVAAYEVGI